MVDKKKTLLSKAERNRIEADEILAEKPPANASPDWKKNQAYTASLVLQGGGERSRDSDEEMRALQKALKNKTVLSKSKAKTVFDKD